MKQLFLVLCLSLFIFCACNQNVTKIKPLSLTEQYQKYPDSLEIVLKYANTLFNQFKYDQALQVSAKAFRLAQKNDEARYVYARCLLNHSKRTDQDVLLAQGHLKYYVKKNPKNPEGIVQLAASYFQLGDNQKAFEYCNEALRVDLHYRDAYILKGTMYLNEGNNKLAKSSYQTAIEQDPEFYLTHIQLGTIYQAENDSLCLQYFLSAVQLKPYSTDARYNLAYAYQTLHTAYPENNFDYRALETYKEMYRKDPSFSMSLFQQGYIKQFQQNQPDSAKQFYNLCLQKEPTFVEAWHNLGVIYEQEGKPLEAINYYRKAVKYNKEFQLSREAINRLVKK